MILKKRRGQDYEKRAQAHLITAVLLILIVIVGIAVLWVIVSGLVKDNSKNINSDLLGVNLDIKEVVVYATGSLHVKISRTGKGNIDSLKFAFYDEEGNSAVRNVDLNIIEVLETKTYDFAPISEIGKIKSISVFPVNKDNIGREFNSENIGILEVPDSLVSWYEFDDANDFAGDNHGSLNGAILDKGELVLDEGYFSVSDSDSLDFENSMSLSAWIKSDSDGEIISKGNNYKLYLEDGKLKFDFSSGGNIYSKESYSGVVDNQWNHAAVSIENGGHFKMFVNNESVNDIEEWNFNLDVNDDSLKVGQGFKGRIDNVMIFNKALSVEQIRGLYEYWKRS